MNPIAERSAIAASLQSTGGCWLIIYSPYRRTFTGFAAFTREPIIVDEPRVGMFLGRIEQVEKANRR